MPMIDEKKIEETAQRAADLYEQDLPLMSYNEDTEVDGQHHFCQEFGAELFKDGVKWAINEFLKDLWHDVFEEHIPRGKKVIVEYTSKGGIYYRSLKIPDDIQWVRGFSNEKRLRRWLCVDDLFPKEGDENYD